MGGSWLISYLALWAVVLLLVVLVLGLAREIGGIYSRFGAPGALTTQDGLDIGSTAPDFAATEIPSGREVIFQAASGEEALLLFIGANCGPCRNLLPKLAAGWDDWRRHVRCHIVCGGNEAEVRTFAEQTETHIPLLADPLTHIRAEYHHPPTPYAFLIDADGTVKLKGVVNSRDDIDRLIEGRARVPGGRPIISAARPGGGDRTATPVQPLSSREEVEYGQVD